MHVLPDVPRSRRLAAVQAMRACALVGASAPMDPKREEAVDVSRLAVSFSGGETSAVMTRMILSSDGIRRRYDDIVITFANTGQEHHETLQFVDSCDRAFGFNTVWLEALVSHEKGSGTRHTVTTFENASRLGEPFEAVIAKYGIPNAAARNVCTRELKLAPMRSYLRDIGWASGTYDTAIGIRVDEIDRISPYKNEQRLVYPLAEWVPMTKQDVIKWWSNQPFRLGIKGYEGNCTWCWKKSLRKHLTLREESPSVFDFPLRMESEHGWTNLPASASGPRTFFREKRSALDILEMDMPPGWSPAVDDSLPSPQMSLFDPILDIGGGCEESCEAH